MTFIKSTNSKFSYTFYFLYLQFCSFIPHRLILFQLETQLCLLLLVFAFELKCSIHAYQFASVVFTCSDPVLILSPLTRIWYVFSVLLLLAYIFLLSFTSHMSSHFISCLHITFVFYLLSYPLLLSISFHLSSFSSL